MINTLSALAELKKSIHSTVCLYEIEPSIVSVFSERERGFAVPLDEFEDHGVLVGNSYLNRVAWGNWPEDYRAFFLEALYANNTGVILDYGCRSVVYAAGLYSSFKDRTIILMDDSLSLLQHAKRKIEAVNGGKVPENLIFLHASMYELPFRPQSLNTIISFGLLHNMSHTEIVTREFRVALKETGDIYLTSLVTDRKFGKYFMNMLNRAGEAIFPRSSVDLHALLEVGVSSVGMVTKGNMAYIACHR